MLLLAVVVSGIILAIGLTLLSISLKQFKISGLAENSEKAFHAANAGVECARYWDLSSENGGKFDVVDNDSQVTIQCLGKDRPAGGASSGNEQRIQEITWSNEGSSGDNTELCTDVSIWKFYSEDGDEDMGNGETGLPSGTVCPEGVECTVIRSRGYNRACNDLGSLKTVERELFVRY